MREVPCPACEGSPAQARVARGHRSAARVIAEVCRAADRRGRRVPARRSSCRPREQQIAERVLKEINERLRLPARRRPRLPLLDRPPGTLSGGEAQRIRLATQIGSGLVGVLYVLDEPSHRPAPARQPPADRDPGPAARPRQHADRRRARRGHHPRPPTGSSTSAPAPASTAARSSHSGPVEDLLEPPRLADRRVPLRPARDPDARRCAGRATRAASSPCTAPGSTTCSDVDVSFPLGLLRRGHRGVRLGQVDAGQRHPLHRRWPTQINGARHGARPAHDGSPASSTSTRSSTSTSRPIGRTPAVQPGDLHRRLRPHPQAVRRRPPRRRCAATSRAGSRSTSRAAAARRAPATARSRSR